VRRRRDDTVAGLADLPERLRRFRLADWARGTSCRPGDDLKPWRAWQQARRTWCEAHGVTLWELNQLSRDDAHASN
jgi:hypothetical protein